LLTPERMYVFERSIHGERRLNCTTHDPERLVEEEWRALQNTWQPLQGGPWVAKLMRPSRQPVAHASYRNFYVTLPFDPDTTPLAPGGQVKFPFVAGAPAEGIVCALPPSWSGRDKSFVFRLKLAKNGCAANQVIITQALFRGPTFEEDGEGESGGEGGEGGEGAEGGAGGDGDGAASVVPLAQVPAGALAAPAVPVDAEAESTVSDGAADAIQMAARATHLETNLAMPEAPTGSMAALAREALVRSDGELPGEGEAVVEPPSTGPPPSEYADVMAVAVAGDADGSMLANAPLLSPPPVPPPAPPASLPPSRSGRKRTRKAFFGDAGELDGAASSFRSAPMDRKASVDPSEEMGVPPYAMPGSEVLAMGLHAGVRKRFKAVVTGLRKQFPRIVVKYIATEDGGTHPLELPDPITAYVTMSDVEAGTLVMA
jgi:hypothetical protein